MFVGPQAGSRTHYARFCGLEYGSGNRFNIFLNPHPTRRKLRITDHVYKNNDEISNPQVNERTCS